MIRRPTLCRAAALVVLVLAGATAVRSAPAGAHALLVSADPADGAKLSEAPEEVRLTFSEPVSAELGGLRVFAADGTRVDRGAVRVEDRVVEVDVVPDLGEGSYVVTYRIISADAHPVRGGLVFSVGDGAADPSALGGFLDTSEDRFWEVVGAVGRALAYAGLLLAAGGALFLAVVHRARGAERDELARIVAVAAVVGVVASLVAVPVQAALGTGQGAGSLLEAGVARDVLRDGLGWSIALGVVGAAALLLGLRWRRSATATLGGAVATGAFVLVGHTTASEPAWLARVADVIHVWAAAAWFGGLVLLWRTLRARARAGADAHETASVVSRFSSLAAVSLLVVAAAGSAMTWIEVRAAEALTSTTYGWVLVAKVGIVLVVAAIALYNRFGLVPAMRAGKAKAALARIRRTVSVEAAALVVVVALAAVLVNVTPARTAAGIAGLFEETVQLGDAGSVQIVVDPARAGDNEIHLYTYDPSGRPADIAESLTLELSLPAAGLGPIERQPYRAGPAHHQLDGDTLATAGTWVIEIIARVDRFSEETGTVEVPVSG